MPRYSEFQRLQYDVRDRCRREGSKWDHFKLVPSTDPGDLRDFIVHYFDAQGRRVDPATGEVLQPA
jgi:hypothetical protein